LLSWNGFGLKAKQTRRSGLQRAIDGKASFSPRFALTEATAGGLAPPFSPFGFVRPDAVSLIADGRPQDPLVSPRSAREYGVPTNGASDDESPQSAAVAGGTLADADVLRELGTGLWVPNLWYLNWSDRTACRATGMTRFATMWVEDGRIVCPVDVMRFDAVLYDLLGAGLVAFGERVELMPDTSTYERRSTASLRAPGALVDGLTFTL
jgi:predicted Zn-dependent protease